MLCLEIKHNKDTLKIGKKIELMNYLRKANITMLGATIIIGTKKAKNFDNGDLG